MIERREGVRYRDAAVSKSPVIPRSGAGDSELQAAGVQGGLPQRPRHQSRPVALPNRLHQPAHHGD